MKKEQIAAILMLIWFIIFVSFKVGIYQGKSQLVELMPIEKNNLEIVLEEMNNEFNKETKKEIR